MKSNRSVLCWEDFRSRSLKVNHLIELWSRNWWQSCSRSLPTVRYELQLHLMMYLCTCLGTDHPWWPIRRYQQHRLRILSCHSCSVGLDRLCYYLSVPGIARPGSSLSVSTYVSPEYRREESHPWTCHPTRLTRGSLRVNTQSSSASSSWRRNGDSSGS